MSADIARAHLLEHFPPNNYLLKNEPQRFFLKFLARMGSRYHGPAEIALSLFFYFSWIVSVSQQKEKKKKKQVLEASKNEIEYNKTR